MAEHLRRIACLLALSHALGGIALAETLADPTRPPASLSSEIQPNAASVPAGPVLQSVLISSKQAVAIISGETVKVGDKVGEARVAKIAEGEVVLRKGKEVQTLKLYPDIEKLPASRPGSGKQGSSGNEGK